MKSWFVRWRVSAALDEGRAPWPWLRRWANRSRDLRTIEPEMIELDRALRRTVPRQEPPASLHHSVMHAVRASETRAPERRAHAIPRWLPAPVLAAAAVAVIWLVSHQTVQQPVPDAQALSTATTALEAGGQFAEAAPAVVVAPLSDELQRLNQDLRNTAQFLLASVP
jgi:hypothetical protein